MSVLRSWAAQHGVSFAAVADLERRLGVGLDSVLPDMSATPAAGESRVQSLVRLEAARKNIKLFRNNSGAFKDASGRVVRYGLANESAQMNRVFKSPDLIGWKPVRIEYGHIGQTIGQCVLREIKHPGWTFSGTPHETAQRAFIELAVTDGCDAMFCTTEGTL